MSTPAQPNLGGPSLPNAKAFAATAGSACLTVANPKRVPKEIAVCPECGGGLWWQFTTTDWLRDMHLDCENDPEGDDEDTHRNWQSDWQPVIDRVRRWLGSGLGTQIDPDQRPGQ